MGERVGRQAVVLLVEDDPEDQELTRRALEDGVIKADLHVVSDGVEAMKYLLQEGAYSGTAAPYPDLILLDPNMPKLNSRRVLERMRAEPNLKRIPVVILTTSQQEEDIVRSYDLGCNSFITKPVDLECFFKVVRELRHYWFKLVTLPEEVAA